MAKIIESKYFQSDALTLAKKLIGKKLVREVKGQKIVGKIVETEAYMGKIDKASHTHEGKKTERTKILYSAGGLAYVYTIYGIYNCFNIVANSPDLPEAVFIRAVEPLTGIEMMAQNRASQNLKKRELTNGPAKLCQALAIDKDLNGHDLKSGQKLYLEELDIENKIVATARINIDYAEEDIDNQWRFYLDKNPYVSN